MLKDKIIRYILASAASISVLVVLLVFYFLFKESFLFAQANGIKILLGTQWKPVSFFDPSFGVLPLITGSFLVTCIAGLIAIPLGIVIAVYLAEIAGEKEKEILKPLIEILASLPSVVLGFFGLVVLAPLIQKIFNLNSGLTALTGAVLLAVMAIPTITSVSEDALRAVPALYKQASLALGASRLQTIWRVTVPAGLSGIVAAVMLGMGRVIGETMAVLMVTGNAPALTFSPTESARTMTATIASEMGEVAQGSEHYGALFWVGLILLFITFLLVAFSQRILKKYQNFKT